MTKAEEIFNVKAEYNKWLKELTYDEKDLVIEMINEAFRQCNVGFRFYRGYTIRNRGYYPPDKCVRWEAVNDETGEVDFHAKRLKDIIAMISKFKK